MTRSRPSPAGERRTAACAVLLAACAAALAATAPPQGREPATRTPAEVEALIQQAGQAPPDWWDEVPLDYPETLDLTWTAPTKPWNPNKNIGQYVWDIINPNTHRWREGVRFMHYVLSINQDRPASVMKAMESLAHMYHNLLQDWARAAFWLRQIGARRRLNARQTVLLANCYWRLGSPEMAARAASRMGIDYTGGRLVQLWADMGDLDTALRLAEATARAGMPDAAYLAAGNACRQHGHYQPALAYYRESLAAAQRMGDRDLAIKRCRANIEAIGLFETLDLARVPDGTFGSDSMGYNGPIRIAVTVNGGRIESVELRQHNEKQFFNAFTETVDQIIAKQGVRGIDATTGATMTSSAVMNATAKALAGAMR